MVYPNKKFDELIKRNQSSLIHLEAKIAYLNDGVKGLGDGFKDFKEDITNFMAFTAETYSDHETRIKNLESKIQRS